jgi:hypothetical protein
VFLKSNDIEIFFYENYQDDFYKILTTGIEIQKMPNGVRREKKYDKKTAFNNRILNRSLNKISEYLNTYNVRLNKGEFNNSRTHKMTFYFDEKGMPNGYAIVHFDKLLWEHKIEYVESQEPDYFIGLIKEAFKLYTSSTKNVRKRLYANKIK